jgi:hypothetical protein
MEIAIGAAEFDGAQTTDVTSRRERIHRTSNHTGIYRDSGAERVRVGQSKNVSSICWFWRMQLTVCGSREVASQGCSLPREMILATP